MLGEGVLGNPHSANPASSAATALVERARTAVSRRSTTSPFGPDGFCNPGAGEVAFSISTLLHAERFEAGTSFDDSIERVGMETGGAGRLSLGIASTFADVYRFMAFATSSPI